MRLELHPLDGLPDAGPGMPTWRAVLGGRGLDAELTFAEAGWEPSSLADFLTRIAAGGRAWQGERTWRSAEAELRMTVLHDAINTVLVRVELEDGAPPHWRCEAELEVDPGAFQQFAEDISRPAP